ncbi:MAG: hypothetical protein LQ350_000193 [Teloschistes chrysophthalmus]|nr:MAG: hypothetical protein LQ350_000193 [Niorma chrysophthalma]
MHTRSSSMNWRAGTSHSPASKQQLQSTTRKLLMLNTPEDSDDYTHEYHDYSDCVDPVKFSPPDGDRSSMQVNEDDFYTRAKPESYYEGRMTNIDDLLMEYEKTYGQPSPPEPRYQPTKYEHKPKGMSQSMSENNISFRRQNDHSHSPPKVTQQHVDYDLAGGSPYRGRHASRTPSPIKGLEKIKEDPSPEGIRDQAPSTNVSMDPPASPIKRSRSPIKQFFGDKGFLGRSTSMKEMPSEEHRKKGMKQLSEKLKQRMGEMTDGVSKLLPASISNGELSKLIPASISTRDSPSKVRFAVPTSTFPVSLSPPEQAKFYSEVELMICATANNYLLIQKEEERMSYESIHKVTTMWNQKNRPQVIDFMFDQLTQRDLILYNIKTFRFYGPNAENVVKINAMMNCWKTVAKEMSVRTFCTGDSTMRKQIQDIYKILEMLGAPMVSFMAFQQIQIGVLKRMREEQEKRDQHQAIQFGVQRKWEPPGGFGPRDSADSEAYIDHFKDF